MKLGFSCRIHFLYTLITFLVAEASHDGNRKAFENDQIFQKVSYLARAFFKLCFIKHPAEGDKVHVIALLPSNPSCFTIRSQCNSFH